MFQTPAGSTGLPWQPVRIDLLFYKVGGQARDLLNDFYVSLYADDGTAEHNPGVMVRKCLTRFMLVYVHLQTAASCVAAFIRAVLAL